eukprot:CAMPEP_0177731616 /NCGR_PEP_ID=MMETSP0484_2-20121128/22650_1 /TAXON_ID=354590 /ORGANISM="Rhodomonas lens, Strain RHODO" /LENGTH=55 /DNA_ID=CAMNT_0019244749 /DNA_START=1 /DNA_END=165 /DNA_ORIENTATION=+
MEEEEEEDLESVLQELKGGLSLSLHQRVLRLLLSWASPSTASFLSLPPRPLSFSF